MRKNTYSIQVKNRIACLQEETPSTNETNLYEQFIQAKKEARVQLIPRKKENNNSNLLPTIKSKRLDGNYRLPMTAM